MIISPRLKRIGLALCIVLPVIPIFYSESNLRFNFKSAPAVQQHDILEFEDYVQRAKERITSLKEAIKLFKGISGRVTAYAFLLHSAMQGSSPDFYIDRDSLTEEELAEVLDLRQQMVELNKAAFTEAQKACARVVEAQGYGDPFLRFYYGKKYNELSDSEPM